MKEEHSESTPIYPNKETIQEAVNLMAKFEKEGYGDVPIETNNESYKVSKIVRNKEYRQNFITKWQTSIQNDKLYLRALDILRENDKSNTETMFIIEADGMEIASDKAISGEKVKYSTQMTEYRKEAEKDKKENYVLIHNHPLSLQPSFSDIRRLGMVWKGAICGYVACHDGKVWRYKANDYNLIEKMTENGYNSNIKKALANSIINNTNADEEIIKIFKEVYDVEMEVLKNGK